MSNCFFQCPDASYSIPEATQDPEASQTRIGPARYPPFPGLNSPPKLFRCLSATCFATTTPSITPHDYACKHKTSWTLIYGMASTPTPRTQREDSATRPELSPHTPSTDQHDSHAYRQSDKSPLCIQQYPIFIATSLRRVRVRSNDQRRSCPYAIISTYLASAKSANSGVVAPRPS